MIVALFVSLLILTVILQACWLRALYVDARDQGKSIKLWKHMRLRRKARKTLKSVATYEDIRWYKR